MNPNYMWFDMGFIKQKTGLFSWLSNENSLKRVIDIMASPIQNPSNFKSEISPLLLPETILCIGGELKQFGEGNPCSNFRKKDPILNENLIKNFFHLFQSYKVNVGKPIFITTIPRSWRSYSWLIQDDGDILRKNLDENGECCDTLDKDLMNFLESMDITKDKLIKIRESCKSSKYHTYLIDMISFLYQLEIDDSDNFHDYFNTEYRSLLSIRGGIQIDNWIPDKDMFYFYQNKTIEKDGYLFYVPNESSIKMIYQKFYQAISLEDNEIKEIIRNYCMNTYIHRWSDFDVNDTDDSFTILMILNAFKSKENLTDEEISVKSKIESQFQFWFDQLV